jgi:hypothetical protein
MTRELGLILPVTVRAAQVHPAGSAHVLCVMSLSLGRRLALHIVLGQRLTKKKDAQVRDNSKD